MPNQALVDFVKNSLQQGHDAYEIHNHLIRNGYTSDAINEALNEVYRGHDKATHNKWVIVVFALLILIVLVFGILWIVFFTGEPGTPPSQPTSFTPSSSSPSSSASQPGTSGNCFDAIKNNQETGIDCGGPCRPCPTHALPDTTDSSTPPEDDSSHPEGDTEPSDKRSDSRPSWEILSEVHDIALVDPDRASRECSNVIKQETQDNCYLDLAAVTKNADNCKPISDETTRDGCYAQTANKAKDPSICSKVVYVDLRDSCYMDFILDGDTALCDNIQTEYYMSACGILRNS